MTYGAWVLILTILGGGGVSVTSIDRFEDKAACQLAARQWLRESPPDTAYHLRRATCVTRATWSQ